MLNFCSRDRPGLKDSVCTSTEGPLSFTGHLTTGKNPDFLKLLNSVSASGLISHLLPLLPWYFFPCTCPCAHFTKRLCWNQSCPEMHTHLLKCRGRSERRLCKLTTFWWVLNLWCLSPLAFRHLKVCHLSAPVFAFLCVGFYSTPTKLSDSSSVPGPNSILMLSLLASWFNIEFWWKTSF